MASYLNVKARIDLDGLIRACEAVPEMLEAEPRFEIECQFDGGSLSCNSIEEVVEIVRSLLKRNKEKTENSRGRDLPSP